MTALAWLEKNVQGFAALDPSERQIIFEFTMLWSIFEAKALHTRASFDRIVAAVNVAQDRGRLDIQLYEPHLDYFRSRYFADGQQTSHFEHLNLANGRQIKLVAGVLKRDQSTPPERLSALLIIVYRFRNNLLHGLKWAYELRNQRENFSHASSVLTIAYDQLVLNDD
jgi:hypothetical protein